MTQPTEEPPRDWETHPEQIKVDMQAQATVRALESAGYGLVIVTIARELDERDENGLAICAGATTIVARDSLSPVFPEYARTLRKVADDLDEAFAKSGTESASGDTVARDWEPEGAKG